MLVEAAETGSDELIREATEKLLAVVEEEGWMTRRSMSHRV